jgi:streptomycin 3"-adenylyltransferase
MRGEYDQGQPASPEFSSLPVSAPHRTLMSALSSRQTEQVRRTINAMQEILGRALLAVFLHGSATTTGLRPESDIDLLAMIDRPMSERERKALLTDLLHLSSRLPGAVDDPRRLEVMVIIAAPRKLRDYPARAEFIYGEWLRNEGAGLPMPGRSAENTLILAQTGRNAVVLFGEDAAGYLPKIAAEDIRQALEDAIPPLLDWLHGDERNVLLTLARMGWTTSTGEGIVNLTAKRPDNDAGLFCRSCAGDFRP